MKHVRCLQGFPCTLHYARVPVPRLMPSSRSSNMFRVIQAETLYLPFCPSVRFFMKTWERVLWDCRRPRFDVVMVNVHELTYYFRCRLLPRKLLYTSQIIEFFIVGYTMTSLLLIPAACATHMHTNAK